METVNIQLKKIEPNAGQIAGLPKNPRFIKDEKFRGLVDSIRESPEMLEMRELLVYPHEGKYVIIGGNMRYRAMKELGYTEAPCKVIPESATAEQLRAYTIKDNNGYGEWDFDMLSAEWDNLELTNWDVDFPDMDDDEQEIERKKKEFEDKMAAGKAIFGKGYIVSDRAFFEREKAEREKAEREKAERWELGEKELAIIQRLNRNGNNQETAE